METELENTHGIDIHFLRHIILYSLTFGVKTTCVPICLGLTVELLADRGRVWASLSAGWLTSLLGMTVVFLVGTLVGSIRFSLSKLPSARRLGAVRCTRAGLAEVLGAIHTSADSTLPMNPCSPALSLLASMGLINLTPKSAVAVSAVAESFIASLRAHLLDGNPCFIGKWDAGKTEAESKRLVRLEFRLKKRRWISDDGCVAEIEAVACGAEPNAVTVDPHVRYAA
jgi:hypothetical protein